MVTITIDGFELVVPREISILEACKYAGVKVPRFCYHEILSVSGNCRMCLVEIEDLDKPVASCVTEIVNGMSVFVNSPMVQKARSNVMEFLLINHPLDCPICDQAGECDLQDQAKVYGGTHTRYYKHKTGVEDKNFGPLIKTIMTRCIACTRCVRYSAEVAGVEFFGTLNRGGSTEIGSYSPNFFKSEISGNVIDLCPVGALTAKPSAFKLRPWELKLSETVDCTDSLGANLYVNHKGLSIARVLPKPVKQNQINDMLISDKTRFGYDAVNTNRIKAPLHRNKPTSNLLEEYRWNKIFKLLDIYLTNKSLFVVNEKTDFKTLCILNSIQNLTQNRVNIAVANLHFGKSNLVLGRQMNLSRHLTGVLEKNPNNKIVLFGCNLAFESPIVNVRVRKKLQMTALNLDVLGSVFTTSYTSPVSFKSLSLSKAQAAFEGKKGSQHYSKADLLTVIVGESLSNRMDNFETYKLLLSTQSSNVQVFRIFGSNNGEGVSFLNLKSLHSSHVEDADNLILLNLDDNQQARKLISNKCFANKSANKVFWLNAFNSNYANENVDVVLPTTTAFESESAFMNLDNTFKKTRKVLTSLWNSQPARKVVLSLFDSLTLNAKKAAYVNAIESVDTDIVNSNLAVYKATKVRMSTFGFPVNVSKYPIKHEDKDFYQTDIFSRNSSTLVESSQHFNTTRTSLSTLL